MTCTVAAIIAVLGYMPPPGTVITVPKAATAHYSSWQQAKAKRCARRYGIELREGE
jgi:hypothetical protein